MAPKITYKPFGNRAILIEWKAIISDDLLQDILCFKDKIATYKKDFYVDLIVGYNSLTIKYSHDLVGFEQEITELKEIYLSNAIVKTVTNYIWEIPVCYDAEFGIDMLALSEKLNKTPKEIIALHSGKLYTVFFIGFLPGFMYLGGLHKELFFNRKPNPRLHVPKGSVAIGGQQTGVYPMDSAGGWNIIGKTPIPFFDIHKEQPCFVKAGDKIKFTAVSLKEFYQIESKVIKGDYLLTKKPIND